MVFPLISGFSVSKKQERHKREGDVPSGKKVVIFNGTAAALTQSACVGERTQGLLWPIAES